MNIIKLLFNLRKENTDAKIAARNLIFTLKSDNNVQVNSDISK